MVKDFVIQEDRELDDDIQLTFPHIGYSVINPCYGLDGDNLEEFESAFKDPDFFIELQSLMVDRDQRGKGHSKMILHCTLEYIKQRFGEVDVYLNASPMGLDGLQLNALINLYEGFGFRVFLNQKTNVLMIKN
jgi:GNAT superfamily N-acetyltransferase